MENLEEIIQLLYKKMPAQRVIQGDIKYDDFDKAEFIRMSNSYVLHYSENESWNLLNYFLDTFYESAKKNGRKLSTELNVFEPLFYYAQEFLLIRNNEILCHYPQLMEWKRMTTEISEDLIVTAFLAMELTHAAMHARGFSWKTVIGHDNAQINALMRRGISENHSHLNGAAPIFKISWLSLMNNVDNSQLGRHLRSYDKDRKYTNVAYTSSYRETSFYEKYMQAALIRLLLYCKISGKRLKIGKYDIAAKEVQNLICFPHIYYREGKEIYLDNEAAERTISRLLEERDKYLSFGQYAVLMIESCDPALDQREFWSLNPELEELLRGEAAGRSIHKDRVCGLVARSKNTTLSRVFLKLLCMLERLVLEDIQTLFSDQEIFADIWEERTLNNVKELLKEPGDLLSERNTLQSIIDVYRMGDSGRNEEIRNLDYILNHLQRRGSKKEEDNFVFSGERWLMYTMLRGVYLKEGKLERYFNLFYAYLLIKESIRSELVQSNKNIGFVNFQKYQDRKGDLLADAVYRSEFTRLAVSNSLVSKNIRRMELRITPDDSIEKNHKKIRQMDRLVLPDKSWEKRLFYTVHFIKGKDDDLPDTGYMYCRHYQKRKDIERRAYALTGLRERDPLVGNRILGIDAAANEIGCRPEVFAPMFRYLKDHRYSYYEAGKGKVEMPQLNTTYHVGEDFLDLADGLRAIDEAVLFLNLGSGDRLGHALALGVNVRDWYQGKRHRIVLPVQDHLDNLVWVYHKLIQYDIRGFENLKDWICGKYTVLFGRLYKGNISQGEIDAVIQEFSKKKENKHFSTNCKDMDFGIFNYYHAWQLRGDDPALYELGYFEENEYLEKQEDFRVDFHHLKDLKMRRIPEAALLYYMYHYNKEVRRKGAKTIEVSVTPNYAEAVAAIQKSMQKEIAGKGIAIETNPTSNYMIGTFRRYEKHPILCFYNKGLTHDPGQIRECPQLSVSINTDDQGVFSTSLENEYALMACALESIMDEEGNPVYNRTDIYDWLDKIRVMGNEQSFGAVLQEEEEDLICGEENSWIEEVRECRAIRRDTTRQRRTRMP